VVIKEVCLKHLLSPDGLEWDISSEHVRVTNLAAVALFDMHVKVALSPLAGQVSIVSRGRKAMSRVKTNSVDLDARFFSHLNCVLL